MKPTNANAPDERGRAVARGHLTWRRAGGQIRVRDARGNDFVAGTLRVENVSETDDDELVIGASSYLAKHFENASGGTLVRGAVVVIENNQITTTTTPQDTRPIGVVAADTADGEQAPVILVGYASVINTNASVTAANYAETSADAGEAQESATRRIGSFAQFLSTGTNPDGYLFGVADSAGTGTGGAEAVIDHGNMGSTETLDMDDGTWHRGTLNANCTITVTGFSADEGLVAIFEATQDGTGGWGITWDSDVVAVGDDQPDLTADTTTVFLLFSSYGDSLVYLVKVGGGVSADGVKDAGRWEHAVLTGSPPDDLYADGDWLYIWVPGA